MKKTLTEKRFFEWHEDDVSVTLRNRSGSYGGAARYSLSAISRHGRIALCHRLQMGATRTSNAREVDSMRKKVAYGVVICYTIDEKMGNTYIHEEQANTLAQRDYKQPQAVIYETADSSGIKSKPCNNNK